MDITVDTPEQDVLAVAKDCKACGSCCRYGSGLVLEHEIPAIAGSLNHDISSFKEHFLRPVEFFNTKAWRFNTVNESGRPFGPCMFLDRGACRIHDVKPLHCRVGTCSPEHGDRTNAWFMVRNFVRKEDPESVRQYHAYVKTGGLVLPGAELESLVPNKARLKHILDYRILK